MAYLVTGGTGSMGVYVVRDLLKEGKEVVCLQRSGETPFFHRVISEDKIKKVKIVQGDISNTQQLNYVIQENHIDTVIHLSAQTPTTTSESQPAYALYVNCVGMNNILEASRLFGIRRVVWTSSFQSVGDVVKVYKEPIRDEALYRPDSMYSAAKALNEYMARHYYEKFGVDSIGLRIGLILNVNKSMGKGGSFTQYLKNAATNRPAVMTAMDADHPRPLGYVENISDLLLKACASPTTRTRVFNAGEYMVSCRQIVESTSRVNPGARVSIKDGVSEAEATWGGAQEPIIDASGIRRELGWEPKFTFDEALKNIFNYFRQQEGMPPL